MKWTEGPRKRGCTYHKQAVHPLDRDSLVVDVFIMPSIVKYRPIAITVGRYRNYKPIQKEKWQIRNPDDLTSVARDVPKLLVRVGVQSDDAQAFTSDIELFLKTEAPTLKKVLRESNSFA